MPIHLRDELTFNVIVMNWPKSFFFLPLFSPLRNHTNTHTHTQAPCKRRIWWWMSNHLSFLHWTQMPNQYVSHSLLIDRYDKRWNETSAICIYIWLMCVCLYNVQNIHYINMSMYTICIHWWSNFSMAKAMYCVYIIWR